MTYKNPIMVGIRGENGARTITLDASEITAEHPGAQIELLLQRRGEDIAYVAEQYTVDGSTVTWTPTDIDTGIAGTILIQIIGHEDDTVVKQLVLTGLILPAIGVPDAGYPEPIRDWMTALQEMLAYAAKLQNVSASATDLAPGSPVTVTVTQTDTSTTFSFGIPMATLPGFEIDENGRLVATYPDYTSDVGPITAYAQAVAGGYTGTLEEFEEDVGNSAANAQAAAEAAASVSPSTSDDVDYILGV